MKKLFLTLLIVLGLGFGSFAQFTQDRGLFGNGPDEQSGGTRTSEGLILPTTHGDPNDSPANNDSPLGGGVLLLAGLGAAYAVSKKRKA